MTYSHGPKVPFSWTCPFCSYKAIIQQESMSIDRHAFDCMNKHGIQAVYTHIISCPNEDCKEYSLSVTLHNAREMRSSLLDEEAKQEWCLIPQSEAQVMPDYVPLAITEDYKEACAIKNLSPKASATLSRRCLQGMIRDFWKISERNLYLEIDAIQDKVDPETWDAIDAVRKLGNIGAHMGDNINLIVDVDPNEAGLMIRLIETLIKEWYVAREERKKNMEAIVEASEQKQEARNPQKKIDISMVFVCHRSREVKFDENKSVKFGGNVIIGLAQQGRKALWVIVGQHGENSSGK